MEAGNFNLRQAVMFHSMAICGAQSQSVLILTLSKKIEKAKLLGHLRQKITETDWEVIRLLGIRRRLVLEVGEVKRKHGMAVRDVGREEVLLSILTSSGAKEGLSPDYVRSLYRIIIEHSVAEELELMK